MTAIVATCMLIVLTTQPPKPAANVAILDMQNRWYVEDWGRVEKAGSDCVLGEILARHRAGTLNETSVPDRSCPPGWNLPAISDAAYLACKK